MSKFFVLILFFLSASAPAYAAGSDSGSSSNSAGGGDSSYGSGGDEGSTPQTDPLYRVKRLIYKEKYAEAYVLLSGLKTPKIEDDRQNLMGFTARKSGDFSTAKKHYASALKLSPKHLGALEYQGELFIALGDFDSAIQNLEKIKSICWLGCKEKRMLTKALKKAGFN